MENQRLIAEFNKNSLEKVRIVLTEFKGKKLLDIRVYYDASENEEPDWRPTKKGISISLDLIDELLKGLEKAKKMLEKGQDEAEGRDEVENDR